MADLTLVTEIQDFRFYFVLDSSLAIVYTQEGYRGRLITIPNVVVRFLDNFVRTNTDRNELTMQLPLFLEILAHATPEYRQQVSHVLLVMLRELIEALEERNINGNSSY